MLRSGLWVSAFKGCVLQSGLWAGAFKGSGFIAAWTVQVRGHASWWPYELIEVRAHGSSGSCAPSLSRCELIALRAHCDASTLRCEPMEVLVHHGASLL